MVTVTVTVTVTVMVVVAAESPYQMEGERMGILVRFPCFVRTGNG